MSDDTPQKPAATEPSMEDILASIRRILAEDASQDDDKSRSDEPLTSNLFDEEPADSPMTTPMSPLPSQDDGDNPKDTAAGAPPASVADVFVLTPEMRIIDDALPPKEARLVVPPSVEPRATAVPARERRIVSTPAADISADVLSHLAKAILDRRDIAVTTRDVTLEGMVREMLRPLLREWLDRNLPYLIERLVKKEIDLMVNRAERLDD